MAKGRLLFKCSEKSSLPVASDSTKCVQSKWLTSPTLTGACSIRVFRTTVIIFIVIILNSVENRSQNVTETGTCPREKTLSSYERAGGKREGGKILINKKKKKKKVKKEKLFEQFEPATTFSTSFQKDVITSRTCLSSLLLIWCICKENKREKCVRKSEGNTSHTGIKKNVNSYTLAFYSGFIKAHALEHIAF